MPTNKDFKRVVRRRMQKTGESYTAARAQLLRTTVGRSRVVAKRATPVARKATDYATMAGMSDAAVTKATGSPWDHWVRALDRVDAHGWPHRRIVDHLHETYGVPGWWAQMVTVGYERFKGLRARGQRRDGTYEATRSKVFGVPVERLYAAFADARTRARWLPDVAMKVRRATKPKSMRITWNDETSVDIGFFAKGPAKSQVQIAHAKLRDQTDASRRKAFWSERLTALSTLLSPGSQT